MSFKKKKLKAFEVCVCDNCGLEKEVDVLCGYPKVVEGFKTWVDSNTNKEYHFCLDCSKLIDTKIVSLFVEGEAKK